jgi:cystathionine gamma-synthase
MSLSKERYPIPLGRRIPDSAHAVSVSLPALRDLIGYEERDADTTRKVASGYPRFHTHPHVALLRDHLRAKHGLDAHLLLVPSERAGRELFAYAQIPAVVTPVASGVCTVVLPADSAVQQRARAFQQHAGCIISSRRAESLLVAAGLLDAPWTEEIHAGDADRHARATLASAYGAAAEDVHLAVTGMNAIHGLYGCVSAIQRPHGRRRWARHGWTFMDSMKILDHFAGAGVNRVVAGALDLPALERLLDECGQEVAAVFTEVPSNPLVQTPDVPRLRELADRHGCALVIDATLGTPHNVDVLPYADACVESLTKYANGAADVMMGAVVLNRRSRWYAELAARLPDFLDAPYERDVRRLAFNVSGYRERMRKVNQNTLTLVEFFQRRPSVKKVLWAYEPASRRQFERIQRAPGSPGGIITLELNAPLQSVYDRLELAKGPSLGAEFTLVGPYLYHAHYDLVSTDQGGSTWRPAGSHPTSSGFPPVWNRPTTSWRHSRPCCESAGSRPRGR